MVCEHTLVRHSSHLIILDLEKYLKSLEISNYALSKNVEDELEQPLVSAYVLCLYELDGSHISDQGLKT